MNRLTILLIVVGLVGLVHTQDLLNTKGETIYDSFEGGSHPNIYSAVVWLVYDPDSDDVVSDTYTGSTNGAISGTAEVYGATGNGLFYHSNIWSSICN